MCRDFFCNEAIRQCKEGVCDRGLNMNEFGFKRKHMHILPNDRADTIYNRKCKNELHGRSLTFLDLMIL